MSATEIILNICHRLVERRTAGAVPIYHLLSVVMILFFYVFNRFFNYAHILLFGGMVGFVLMSLMGLLGCSDDDESKVVTSIPPSINLEVSDVTRTTASFPFRQAMQRIMPM